MGTEIKSDGGEKKFIASKHLVSQYFSTLYIQAIKVFFLLKFTATSANKQNI